MEERTRADGPGQRPRHRLRRPRRRPAARPPSRRHVAGSRGLRRADPALLEGVPAATCRTPAAMARRAGTRRTGSATTGSSTTWPRSSTRSGLETFHVVGFSMGAMTALQYAHPQPRAPADADDRRDHDAARAARVGGAAADGSGARGPRGSGLGRAARAAATTRGRARAPGAGSCRRSPPTSPRKPLLSPRDLRADRRRRPRRLRRSRSVRAGRPRVGISAAAAGRPAVRGARLRPRGHVPEAEPVQRGAGGVLPLDRGRPPAGRRGGGRSRGPAACERAAIRSPCRSRPPTTTSDRDWPTDARR